MNKSLNLLLLLTISINLIVVNCQSDSTASDSTTAVPITSQASSQTTPTTTTSSTIFTTTTSSDDECNKNVTCSDCLNNKNCFYCAEDSSCRTVKFDGIFPEGCKASQARWFDCSINFQALLIGVIAGASVIVLISLCCFCYCCNKTCKAISDSNLRKVERKLLKQRALLKEKNDERRTERQSKNEAIRIKYGLKPSTYTQIEE